MYFIQVLTMCIMVSFRCPLDTIRNSLELLTVDINHHYNVKLTPITRNGYFPPHLCQRITANKEMWQSWRSMSKDYHFLIWMVFLLCLLNFLKLWNDMRIISNVSTLKWSPSFFSLRGFVWIIWMFDYLSMSKHICK